MTGGRREVPPSPGEVVLLFGCTVQALPDETEGEAFERIKAYVERVPGVLDVGPVLDPDPPEEGDPRWRRKRRRKSRKGRSS